MSEIVIVILIYFRHKVKILKMDEWINERKKMAKN
jgi:hypothetical protein